MCCQSSGQWKSSAQSSSGQPHQESDSESVPARKTTRHRRRLSQNGAQILIPILALILVALLQIQTVAAGAGNSLHGYLESCSNEGEEVQLAKRNQDFKCFNCICQNGFVRCSNNCPPIDDCYMVDRSNGSCCPRCKGCMFRGIPYESGAEWTDPEDPCRTYKCVATVVTETIQKCYSQCDDDQLQPPRPGECCPTCQGCTINGQTVAKGQEVVPFIDDRCLVCQCGDNQLTCSKKTCPILLCPKSKQKQHPDECCPRCTEKREIFTVPGKCFFNKQMYYEKTQFMPDRCTNCTCLNGTSVCQRATCPILECAPEFQEEDGCCPRCAVAEVRSECSLEGVTYRNNETWNMGPCRSCRCNGGTIRCSERRCPAVKCRANEVLKLPPGECCYRCVEAAGTCTVFGDPHFRTFDGKFFSFQGSCKYLLAADCRDNTFHIRLTNEGRGTRHASWAKTITLKLHNLRVNLGQRLRVKVNGTRVMLPYVGMAGGQNVTIERFIDGVGGVVMLRSEMGLQLEWDGAGFLQVTVPAQYKKRLCGLCGNFNGSARDDLTSKDGRSHSDEEVWHFANSWKVGGPKSCSRQRENIAALPTCDKRMSSFYCHPLSVSHLFGECNERLNPQNYIAACRMDVCECPSGSCHCDSFAAYAHECKRLGVILPDWRTATKCPSGFRRNATTLSSYLNNEYYGDSSFTRLKGRGRKQQRQQHRLHRQQLQQLQEQELRRKQERRRRPKGGQHNQVVDKEFTRKHPSLVLHPRAPDRTPPPLH
ncbi:BMP-binding endothelial regulator protein [Drosophila bipectinata]|uniref:BMP-binding endothelial regulator protein n=1 Tax=Drosophila bipectinata TaxID=42026 RepID=UPI001C8AD5F3|nr:BMP-binding endothelial regulator protein [Drosophila bipectinata]